MQKRALLILAAALVTTALVPVAGKDLPFAPPRRPKAIPSPVVFSPFEHEAVYCTLQTGWEMAEQINDKHIIVMQFRPPNKTPANDFINVVTYIADKRSAKDFLEHTRRGMEKMAPKGKTDLEVINATNPGDVMFGYSIKGWIEAPDQYEMQRVIQGQDGLHSIIYHVGDPDVSEADRAKMAAWLKTVKLVTREQYLGMKNAPPAAAAPAAGLPASQTAAPAATGSPAPQAASPSNAAPAKK